MVEFLFYTALVIGAFFIWIAILFGIRILWELVSDPFYRMFHKRCNKT